MDNIQPQIKDKHTLTFLDAATGQYKGTLFVTTGEIIGQPLVIGDQISVTYTEGGVNYNAIYGLKNFNFIRKVQL